MIKVKILFEVNRDQAGGETLHPQSVALAIKEVVDFLSYYKHTVEPENLCYPRSYVMIMACIRAGSLHYMNGHATLAYSLLGINTDFCALCSTVMVGEFLTRHPTEIITAAMPELVQKLRRNQRA